MTGNQNTPSQDVILSLLYTMYCWKPKIVCVQTVCWLLICSWCLCINTFMQNRFDPNQKLPGLVCTVFEFWCIVLTWTKLYMLIATILYTSVVVCDKVCILFWHSLMPQIYLKIAICIHFFKSEIEWNCCLL